MANAFRLRYRKAHLRYDGIGSPYRGYPAKYAAEQLLTKVLEDERDIDWVASPPWYIMEPGLLGADDIERIGLAVFDAGQD